MPSIEIQVNSSGNDWMYNQYTGFTGLKPFFGSVGEAISFGGYIDTYVPGCPCGGIRRDTVGGGWRFENVTIPIGAIITSAVVKFRTYKSEASFVNLHLFFEDADNPTAPTSYNDNWFRPLTDPVSWAITSSWYFESEKSTPNLVSILQAVIDRPGWVSGNAINFHVRDDSTNPSGMGNRRQVSSWDHKYSLMPPYLPLNENRAAKLLVSWATLVDQEDETAADDSINAFSLTDTLSDQAQAGDEIDWQTVGISADGIAVNDSAAAQYELDAPLIDTAGISDVVANDAELGTAATDAAGVNDSADGFNWTAWQAANMNRAVVRYYCTITGAPDLATDIEVPISSFQARKQTGYSTYVSAIIPGMEYASEIAARPNGEIIIEMVYLVGGMESLREEILRADIDQINIYEGPLSRSINIVGYKDQTFATKTSIIYNPVYQSRSSDGLHLFRFAAPDLYLSPGDTAHVGNDSFTVDTVVYSVSAGGGLASMQVQE